MGSRKFTSFIVALAIGAVGLSVVATSPSVSAATTLPAGFVDTTVFSGLKNPTVIQFGPDGRVWVGEKSGRILVFSGLGAATPTVFADLSTAVHNWWDRGLLGLALDPQFPTRPYVYVQYTYNALPGGTAPRWGSDPNDPRTDLCPDPPGGTADGCVVQGRISRLTVSAGGAGNTMVAGSETVLVQDWCNQFPSHSIGALVFGPDGYLYAGGGDGASFTDVDYGQLGGTRPNTANPVTPKNPCGDGPGEGGALRSQSVRTPATATAPATLDGTIIRIDPMTGAAAPGNAFGSRADAKERMVIGYGLRNPFRFAFRPGTSDLWIGDVGWNDWEEIHRITTPTGTPPNFGWPCYEGPGTNPGYQGANLGLCNSLSSGQVAAPYFSYKHSERVVSNDGCGQPVGGQIASSITGLAFYTPPQGAGAQPYPSAYHNALFFTDYNRQCIWYMRPGANGLPDPSTRTKFAGLPTGAVDLVTGPNGDLFWVDLFGGTIHRISFPSANQAPTPSLVATPTSGPAPLAVSFDARGSTDPDGNLPLSYSWDLDGNGTFGDSTSATPSRTYTVVGNVTVSLRVTDSLGAAATTSTVIAVGNTPPNPTISSPSSALTWKVGDQIDFAGSATDAQDGALAPSRLSWRIRLLTCAGTDCITRFEQTYAGVASGTYTVPDWGGAGDNVLELALTATDTGGLSSTVTRRLSPQTATLSVGSNPSGLQVTVGSQAVTTPWSGTVIVGSNTSLGVITPQTLGSTAYAFSSWSDGGAPSHIVTTPAGGLSVTATFTAQAGGVIPGPAAGGWQLNGSAVLTGGSLELTPTSPATRAGTAIYPTAVSTTDLTITFDAYIGGGTGADGLTFAFLPATTPNTALGATGGGLGWAGLGGVAISLDTYRNYNTAYTQTVDPSNNFAGIITAYNTTTATPTYAATSTAIPTLNNTTRRITITTTGGRLRVSIDGTQYLDIPNPAPTTAKLAFTAGTGQLTNRHAITNTTIQTG